MEDILSSNNHIRLFPLLNSAQRKQTNLKGTKLALQFLKFTYYKVSTWIA